LEKKRSVDDLEEGGEYQVLRWGAKMALAGWIELSPKQDL
jgi:hypothetical protein